MRTLETGATRDRILEVALELFTEQGYAGTSIRDIADRVGMTKAAVYYHFRSKEDLLTNVVEPAMTRVGAVLAEHGRGGEAGRRALATALVDVIAEVGTRVAVMLSDPAAGTHLRALSGATGLPQQVGQALLGTPPAAPATAGSAEQIRAACAVASLPAGIAAWRRAHPDQDRPDAATRALLVEIVLAIVAAG